jgi:hypothetical protein
VSYPGSISTPKLSQLNQDFYPRFFGRDCRVTDPASQIGARGMFLQAYQGRPFLPGPCGDRLVQARVSRFFFVLALCTYYWMSHFFSHSRSLYLLSHVSFHVMVQDPALPLMFSNLLGVVHEDDIDALYTPLPAESTIEASQLIRVGFLSTFFFDHR